MNKKGNILVGMGVALAVIFVIGLVLVGWVAGTYNTLVTKDTETARAWGNVETALQRRADLIPNLVEVVKGVANFEKSTYIAVTEARTKWLNAQTQDEKIQASNELDGALSRLLVTVENYPQLKANQNFLALQDELAGTENRIKWERDNYNTAVMDYQTNVRIFPANMIAGMFGFYPDKWKTFKADTGAENAPKVNFG